MSPRRPCQSGSVGPDAFRCDKRHSPPGPVESGRMAGRGVRGRFAQSNKPGPANSCLFSGARSVCCCRRHRDARPIGSELDIPRRGEVGGDHVGRKRLQVADGREGSRHHRGARSGVLHGERADPLIHKQNRGGRAGDRTVHQAGSGYSRAARCCSGPICRRSSRDSRAFRAAGEIAPRRKRPDPRKRAPR